MQSLKDLLQNIKGSQKNSDIEQPELFNTMEYSKEKNILNENHKYISKEYQYYGLRLASKLGDTKRLTMYIKWAKEKPRVILETAYSFAIDYPNAKDRSRIFIWKVKELEKESMIKKKDVS